MKSPKLNANEVRTLRAFLESLMRQSASSLSALLGQPVRFHLTGARELQISSLAEIIGPAANQEFFGVHINGQGDVHPEMAFFLPSSKAKELASQLLHRRERRLTAIGKSSIAEAGNIMAGSFLNGLNKTTGLRVRASAAGLGTDLLRVLLELPMVDMAARTDRVFVAIAHLAAFQSEIVVKSFLMLDPLEARKILSRARYGS